MSRGVPKGRHISAPPPRVGEGARPDSARQSHIRELAPRADIEIDEASTNKDHRDPVRSGFFAQAARISMGDTFPALKSVARFLTFDAYRSLPKVDKLPDLLVLDDRPTPIPGQADEVEVITDAEADALLDWDELEFNEPQPTPYQRYLFDVRIEEYLRQTKEQMSALLSGEK